MVHVRGVHRGLTTNNYHKMKTSLISWVTKEQISTVLSVSARFQIQGAPERIGGGTPLSMQIVTPARASDTPWLPAGRARAGAGGFRRQTHERVSVRV